MKKLTTIISLFTLMLVLSSCGTTNDTSEETQNPNYYSNASTNASIIEEETITTTENPNNNEVKSTKKPKHNKPNNVDYEVDENGLPIYKFNVKLDKYANDEDLSTNTISIDGHKLTFPCTYEEISKEFKLVKAEPRGQLGVVYTDINEIIDQYTNITETSLQTIPKSGKGIITFTFTSDTETSLDKCMCTGVHLNGVNYNNKRIFTIALKGGIHFGVTSDIIKNAYGTIFEESSKKDGDFYYKYRAIKGTHYITEFYGNDDRLTEINFYFPTE